MWRRGIKVLFFVILFAMALFPRHLLIFSVERFTHSYFLKNFGLSFECESIYWKDNTIIFEAGKLSHKDQMTAHFSTASFKPYLNFKSREIGGLLDLSGLQIIYTQEHPSPLSIPASKRPFFFSPNLTLTIHNGQFTFADTKESICLDITHHYTGRQMLGDIVLHCQNQPIECLFSSENGHVEIASVFHNHPISAISQLAHVFLNDFLPPSIKGWQIKEGALTGRVLAQIHDGVVQCCEGNMQLTQIKAEHGVLDLCASARACHLDFAIDRQKLPDWSATLELNQASLGLQEPMWSSIGEIRDIDTTLRVRKGLLQSSSFSGTLLGMQGEVSFDWQHPTTLLSMQMKGQVEQLSSLLPPHLAKKLAQAFDQEPVQLNASLLRVAQEGLSLQGQLQLCDEHAIDFGCQFGIEQTLPSSGLDAHPLVENLKRQFGFSQKRLGWFKAKELPLQQFLSPFLIGAFPLQLSGCVDVEGTFDEKFIVLFHKGKDVKLEGEGFCLEVPSYQDQGVHYIDLMHHEHVGYMPVKEAFYLQKGSGLKLEKVATTFRFDNKYIYASGVQTLWRDLPLQGEVAVTVHSPSSIDIDIQAHCNEGSLETGRALFKYFSKNACADLPLKGLFTIHPGDLCFGFHLDPRPKLVKGSFTSTINFKSELSKSIYAQGTGVLKYDLDHFLIQDTQLTAHVFDKVFNINGIQLEKDASQWALVGQSNTTNSDESKPFKGLYQNHLLQLEGSNLHLLGKVIGNTAIFEEIEIGNMKGGAQLIWTADKILLQTLTIAHPQLGRGELSATFDRQLATGSGKVVVEALDLSHLIPSVVEQWQLQGSFSALGELAWDKREGLKVQLEGEHRHLSFGSLYFGDGDNLRIFYTPQQGLLLEGLEVLGQYRLGALHYDFNSEHAYFEGFDFRLAPDNLPWLVEIAEDLFPGKISSTTLDLLTQIKQADPLCGRLWIDLTPEMKWLHLKLEDGVYYFGQQPWEIHDFSLTYDPYSIEVKTNVLIQSVPTILYLTADSQQFESGKVLIQQAQEDDFLTANWRRDAMQGYYIQEAVGTFAGLSCDLKKTEESTPEEFLLRGTIICKPKQACDLLPDTLYEFINRFEIDGEYQLKGCFSFPKQDLTHPRFSGQVQGCDCSVASLTIASLVCHCYADSTHIDIKDLAIRDWAGHLFCDYLSLSKGGLWQLQAGHIAIHDFRLSRLASAWTRKERGERSAFRSLFISSCELNHVQGYLNDKESFVGGGQLSFTNLPKRTLFSNLMMIPTEITARLGLDLTNFIPVRGTIHYAIGQGKVFLREFQEVYSDAKRSQFYLSDQMSSYVTFDGKLHLCVKMKQYNLLMKLAELFTVTIKGTVGQPQYVFSSQSVN